MEHGPASLSHKANFGPSSPSKSKKSFSSSRLSSLRAQPFGVTSHCGGGQEDKEGRKHLGVRGGTDGHAYWQGGHCAQLEKEERGVG